METMEATDSNTLTAATSADPSGAPGVTPPTIPIEQGNEFLEVRQSAIHGTGGYARRDIPAGTRIVEYVGERIPKEESNRRCEANNEYIFIIDDQWDLDGLQSWNPARFINHSCTPNCEAEWDEDRIFIVALRDIKQGEELSFNYGYDLEDYEDHKCQCRTPKCVGYILAEEYWEELRKLIGPAKACAS
jgi:SET domain-containing protein